MRAAKREAQKIAELREHGISGADVFVHDRGNGVERVEKKVRLDLKAKIFELRLRESSLEFGGGELLGLGDFEALEEIIENDDDGVADEVVGILHGIAKAHDAVIVRAHAEERRERPTADGHQCGVNHGVGGGAEKMKAEANEPMARREKKAARITEDERQQEKCGIGSRNLLEKAAGKSARVLAREVVEIDVAESEKTDEREEKKKKEPGAQGREAQRGG